MSFFLAGHERRERRSSFLSTITLLVLLMLGTVALLLAAALQSHSDIIRHVFFSALQPDGSLQVKDLDAYWDNRRHLQQEPGGDEANNAALKSARLRHVRHVSFSALQSDGSLHEKELELDAYWVDRRRLQERLDDDEVNNDPGHLLVQEEVRLHKQLIVQSLFVS